MYQNHIKLCSHDILFVFDAISFAPIVLLLKVLMAQQDFDKPFTGGLGSYKLYVLVAYHVSVGVT